jgi:hypothetical protein
MSALRPLPFPANALDFLRKRFQEHSMKSLLTILILTLVSSPASAPAQAAQSSEKFSGYAIRFQVRDDLAAFTPIPGSQVKIGFTVPPLMAGGPTPRYSTLISMINLSAERRGDEWDLSVSVTLPKGDCQVLAVGRLKEAEKLKVEKFVDYDLRPSEVSIVKIDPVPAIEPQIVNLTSSIEVSSIKATVIPVAFSLVLKNNSNKRVKALEINAYTGTSMRYLVWPQGSEDQVLIEPGGSYKTFMPSDTSYKLVAPDEYEPSQPDRLEIATVVFIDGSYEGNPSLGRKLAAKAIGARVQLDRVLPLIASAIDSAGADTAAVLANFKESVWSLGVSVQPAYADQLKMQFPTLEERELNELSGSIGWGLGEVRSRILIDLNKFSKEAAKDPAASVRGWLTKEREKCETWQSLLP